MSSSEEATANAAEREGVPPVLYRFRTYGSRDGDRESVVQLLAGRLRFAFLRHFNDPFEGRPRAVPAYQNAGRQRLAMHRYLRQLYRSRGYTWKRADAEIASLMAGKSQVEIVEMLGDLALQAYDNDEVMICCFSAEEAVAAPLTWSHYADGHKGICVHFNARTLPLSVAFKVEYASEYPVHVVPRTHQDPWDAVLQGLYRKSPLWSYEHEYRIVRVKFAQGDERGIASSLGVEWDGLTAIADPSIVCGVTLGARIPAPVAEELTAVIAEKRPDIELWRASLHRSRYEIVRERIR